MLLVNITGQPGAGKSTLAAGVFHVLKTRSWNVELVIEYTKELNHQRNFWTMSDELLVFAEKYKRIKKFADVDIVITDSPLQCSMHYGGEQFGQAGFDFFKYVSDNVFDSIYFVMPDPKKYVPVGRLTDVRDAKRAGDAITSYIRQSPWPVWDLTNDVDHVKYVVDVVETVAQQKNISPH